MSYSDNKLRQAISDARKATEERKKRNFTESMEMLISLRDINLKDPSQRFNFDSVLPNHINDSPTITVFAEGDMQTRGQAIGLTVYGRDEMEDLGKNPKEARKIANNTDYFICMAPLMPILGRYWGKVLGPRGKMAKPVPPNADLEPLIESFSRTIKLRVKENPSVNVKIGTLAHSDEELSANAQTVVQSISNKLPKGIIQIRKIAFKTTMGPCIVVKK